MAIGLVDDVSIASAFLSMPLHVYCTALFCWQGYSSVPWLLHCIRLLLHVSSCDVQKTVISSSPVSLLKTFEINTTALLLPCHKYWTLSYMRNIWWWISVLVILFYTVPLNCFIKKKKKVPTCFLLALFNLMHCFDNLETAVRHSQLKWRLITLQPSLITN